MEDVSSLRRLYAGDNKYNYNGVAIKCGETDKTTPEFVKFTLGFPLNILNIVSNNRQYDIITADYCLRKFAKQIENVYLEKEHATGKEKFTGKIYIYEPKQKIMLRNSSYVKDGAVCISLIIRFPVYMMSKRTVVNGKMSARIVQKYLAYAIRDFIKSFSVKDYNAAAAVYMRQQEIRQMLKEKGLVGFIANGSILPRNEYGSALNGAVPFVSPPEDSP